MTGNARSSVPERYSEERASASGVFRIGGELPIHRLGFGAMRITGKGVWGEPHDRNEAIRVLRRTLELGINFIDTADSYGPEVSEQLLAEALHPYPKDLVIATKAGFDRNGPGQWTMNGNPKHLREACEGSLRRLKLERIDLYQLHRIDPHYPADDQFGVFKDLQSQEKNSLRGTFGSNGRPNRACAKDCAGRCSTESLQPGRSVLRERSRSLRPREDRLPTMESDQCGQPQRARQGTATGCVAPQNHNRPGRAGMALVAIAGDATDSGYLKSCSSRGKRRGCNTEVRRR